MANATCTRCGQTVDIPTANVPPIAGSVSQVIVVCRQDAEDYINRAAGDVMIVSAPIATQE